MITQLSFPSTRRVEFKHCRNKLPLIVANVSDFRSGVKSQTQEIQVYEFIFSNKQVEGKAKNWPVKRLLCGALRVRNFLTNSKEPTDRWNYNKLLILFCLMLTLAENRVVLFSRNKTLVCITYTLFVSITSTCKKKEKKPCHDPPKGHHCSDTHLLLLGGSFVNLFYIIS